MPAAKYTPEQKNQMIAKVDGLRAKGMTLPEACKKADVHPSMYNWWKAKMNNKAYVSSKSTRMRTDETPNVLGAMDRALSKSPTAEKKELARRTLALLEKLWEIQD